MYSVKKQDNSGRKYNAIVCSDVPAALLNKKIAKAYFARYGTVKNCFANAYKRTLVVVFERPEAALLAQNYRPRYQNELLHIRLSQIPFRTSETLASHASNVTGDLGRTEQKLSTERDNFIKLANQICSGVKDRYRVLDARDRYIRLCFEPTLTTRKVSNIIGTCEDMCPEKERYLRTLKGVVPPFERLYGNDRNPCLLDYRKAIKQFSLHNNIEELPLPCELRTEKALGRSMRFLLENVIGMCDTDERVKLREWFNYLDDRLRAIRWEITERELYTDTTINLMEICTRFYIYCAARMPADETVEFDQQKNTENILECLRDLKHMYSFIAQRGTPCETETKFRGFLLLIYLNNEEFTQELQQMPSELLDTPVVKFAKSARCAISEKNFVRFFALLHATDYFNACILLRYVSLMRETALSVMRATFPSHKPTRVELAKLTDALSFKTDTDAVKFFNHYGFSVIRTTGTVVFEPTAVSYQPHTPYCCRTDVWLVEKERHCPVVDLICGSPLQRWGARFPFIRFSSSFDSQGYFKAHLLADIKKIRASVPESNDANDEVIYISSDSEESNSACTFDRELKEKEIDHHRHELSERAKPEMRTVETQPEHINEREQIKDTPEVPSAEFNGLTLAEDIQRVPVEKEYRANHANVAKKDGQTMAHAWGKFNETSVPDKKVVDIDSPPDYSFDNDSDTVEDSSSLEGRRPFSNNVWQLRERCDPPAESICDALPDHSSASSEEMQCTLEQRGDSPCSVSETCLTVDSRESLQEQLRVRKPGDAPYDPCSPTSTGSWLDELEDVDAVNGEQLVESDIFFKEQETNTSCCRSLQYPIDRPRDTFLEDRLEMNVDHNEDQDQHRLQEVVVISDDEDSHQSSDSLIKDPLGASEVNNNKVQDHIGNEIQLRELGILSNRNQEEDMNNQDKELDPLQRDKQNSEEQDSTQCSTDVFQGVVNRSCVVGTTKVGLEVREENSNRNGHIRLTNQAHLQTQKKLQNRIRQDNMEHQKEPTQGHFSREGQGLEDGNDYSQSKKMLVENNDEEEANPQKQTSGELQIENQQEDIALNEDLNQYEKEERSSDEEGEKKAVVMESNTNELASEELILCNEDDGEQVNSKSRFKEKEVLEHLVTYNSEQTQIEELEFAGNELATGDRERRKQYLARKYVNCWVANLQHAVRCRLLLRSLPPTGQECNNWSRGVKLSATVGKEEPIEPFGILDCAVRSTNAGLREPYYWKLVISISSDDGLQDEKRCSFNSFVNRWLLEAAFKRDAAVNGEQPEHPCLYFASRRSSSSEAAICVRLVREGVDSPDDARQIYDRSNGLLFIMNVYEPIEQVRERFHHFLSFASESRPAIAVLYYCPKHCQPGNVGEELELDKTIVRWKVFRWRNLTDNDPLRGAFVFLAGYYCYQLRDFVQDPGRLEMRLLTAFLNNTVGSEWWSGLENTCKKEMNGGPCSLLGQDGNAVVQLYNVALDRVRHMVAREQLVSFARIPIEFDFLRARRRKSPDDITSEASIPPDWSSAERREQLQQLLRGLQLHPLSDRLQVAMAQTASEAILRGSQADSSQLRATLDCYLCQYPVLAAGNSVRIKLLVSRLVKEAVSQLLTDSSRSAQHSTQPMLPGTIVWIPLLAHVSEAVMRETIVATKNPSEVCYRRSELARFLKAPWTSDDGLMTIPRPSSLSWRDFTNVPRSLQFSSVVGTTAETSVTAQSLMSTSRVGSRKRPSTVHSIFESKLPKMNSDQLDRCSIWCNTDIRREK